MELWARDLMAVQNGAEPFAQGRIALYTQSGASGKDMLLAVMQARRQLKSNVSWQSATEMMFLSLATGKAQG